MAYAFRNLLKYPIAAAAVSTMVKNDRFDDASKITYNFKGPVISKEGF